MTSIQFITTNSLLTHTMDKATLTNELLDTQKRLSELQQAVLEFKELRDEVENSHDNAFGHQPKTVQRKMHRMNEARDKLFDMVKT